MLLRPIIEVVQDFLFVKDGDAIGVIVDADSLQHKAYPLGYSCCSRHCVVFVHVRSTSQDADAELVVFSGSLVCGFLAKSRSPGQLGHGITHREPSPDKSYLHLRDDSKPQPTRMSSI